MRQLLFRVASSVFFRRASSGRQTTRTIQRQLHRKNAGEENEMIIKSVDFFTASKVPSVNLRRAASVFSSFFLINVSRRRLRDCRWRVILSPITNVQRYPETCSYSVRSDFTFSSQQQRVGRYKWRGNLFSVRYHISSGASKRSNSSFLSSLAQRNSSVRGEN